MLTKRVTVKNQGYTTDGKYACKGRVGAKGNMYEIDDGGISISNPLGCRNRG